MWSDTPDLHRLHLPIGCDAACSSPPWYAYQKRGEDYIIRRRDTGGKSRRRMEREKISWMYDTTYCRDIRDNF